MRRAAHVLVLLTTLAIACDRPLPQTLVVEEVVDDLDARAPNVSDAGVTRDMVAPADRLRGQGGRPSLVMPPGTSAHWRLAPTEATTLRYGYAVQSDGRRDRSRAAVRFMVAVDGTPAATHELNPAASRRDRHWFEDEVDLSAYRGKTIDLALSTGLVGGDAAAGPAGWSRVRLVRRTTRPRQPAAHDRPNLLIVLVDTLRADAVGTQQDQPSVTPFLDALAARGVTFTHAVSQCSWTLPSVSTLMTGLPPRTHGAFGQIDPEVGDGQARWGVLGESAVTWAEVASRAGLTTVGVSANPLISRGTNVAQGFETFVELKWDPESHDWPRAREVTTAFLQWLRPNRAHRFVAYLHYMEPHDPYTPKDPPPAPAGVRRAVARGWVQDVSKKLNWAHGAPLSAEEIAYVRMLYRAEVRDWDAEFGRLLDGLATLGVADDTIVVMTADHGEEFQEHGRLKHGSHLYEETIRVPLVIAGPGIPVARRDDVVQGIDLFPTVTKLMGLDNPPGLGGRDLLSPGDPRPAISETASGIAPDGSRIDLTAVRTDRSKLIEAPALPRVELYDLSTDPHETRDRTDLASERTTLSETIATWRAATPKPTEVGNAALGHKLRALGYVQ